MFFFYTVWIFVSIQLGISRTVRDTLLCDDFYAKKKKILVWPVTRTTQPSSNLCCYELFTVTGKNGSNMTEARNGYTCTLVLDLKNLAREELPFSSHRISLRGESDARTHNRQFNRREGKVAGWNVQLARLCRSVVGHKNPVVTHPFPLKYF